MPLPLRPALVAFAVLGGALLLAPPTAAESNLVRNVVLLPLFYTCAQAAGADILLENAGSGMYTLRSALGMVYTVSCRPGGPVYDSWAAAARAANGLWSAYLAAMCATKAAEEAAPWVAQEGARWTYDAATEAIEALASGAAPPAPQPPFATPGCL